MWLTNQVTFVTCDDRRHVGDPIHKVEISFAHNLREQMMRAGWGYDHDKNYHVCPVCVGRNVRMN